MVAIARGCVIELDRDTSIALCAAIRIAIGETSPPPEIEEELTPIVETLEEFFGSEVVPHGGVQFYDDEDGTVKDDD